MGDEQGEGQVEGEGDAAAAETHRLLGDVLSGLNELVHATREGTAAATEAISAVAAERRAREAGEAQLRKEREEMEETLREERKESEERIHDYQRRTVRAKLVGILAVLLVGGTILWVKVDQGTISCSARTSGRADARNMTVGVSDNTVRFLNERGDFMSEALIRELRASNEDYALAEYPPPDC